LSGKLITTHFDLTVFVVPVSNINESAAGALLRCLSSWKLNAFSVGVRVSMAAYKIAFFCSVLLSAPNETKHKHTVNFMSFLYEAQSRHVSLSVRRIRVTGRGT
jgi:hypothetical protein